MQTGHFNDESNGPMLDSGKVSPNQKLWATREISVQLTRESTLLAEMKSDNGYIATKDSVANIAGQKMPLGEIPDSSKGQSPDLRDSLS